MGREKPRGRGRRDKAYPKLKCVSNKSNNRRSLIGIGIDLTRDRRVILVVSLDLHVVVVVVCGLWRASFVKTKREMIIDLMGGQLVVGGRRETK